MIEWRRRFVSRKCAGCLQTATYGSLAAAVCCYVNAQFAEMYPYWSWFTAPSSSASLHLPAAMAPEIAKHYH